VSRLSKALAWLCAVSPAVMTAPEARAEDMAALEGLLSEPIVSSASKQSEGASSAPALSTSIAAEDLRRYGIRTIAQAIDFLGVAASTSDNLVDGELGARGVLLSGDRGSHFLVLVDGYIVNDPLHGGVSLGSMSGVPLELVDHIELIVGPGSVLYGSNAMLGLINIVTKRAKDYGRGKVLAESQLPTSVRAAAGTGQTFKLFGQDAEVTSQLEYYEQNGPDLRFDAENTGIDRFTGQPGRHSSAPRGTGIWGGRDATSSLYMRGPSGVLRFVTGKTEVHAQGSYFKHGSPTGVGDFDDGRTGDKEGRALVGLRHQLAVSNLLELSARASFSYYDVQSHFIASRGVLCPFSSIVGTSVQVTCDYVNRGTASALGLELQSTWDWLHNGRLVTVVGADARRRHLTTSSDTLDVGSGTPLYDPQPGLDVSDVIVAGYAQQTWAPTSTVNLNGGARVDSDPRFSPVVTPRLAASWAAWEGGTLKISYATAFRAPSWNETDNHTARRIVADGLRPEKVQSAEVSVMHREGTHRMLLGAFYSHWDGLVELTPLSDQEAIAAIREGKTAVPFTRGIQLTQYRNASAIDNYGLNMGVDGSLASARVLYGFSLTGALADKSTTAGTIRLPVAPQLFGNGRIALVLGEKLPVLGLAALVVGPRPADLGQNFPVAAYAPSQASFRLSVSGPFPALPKLTYRLVAAYTTAERGPYVVGPVTAPMPTQSAPQLVPVERFRTMVGAAYDF
jgi:outer membrane receptor for ferrienterochelin and colicins